MIELLVQENRVEYAGLFTKPLFSLWGEGASILKGLYDSLAQYHGGLRSFTSVGDTGVPSDQGVLVRLGSQAQFRFKFDRVEAELNSFTDDQLETFPDVLEKGTSWLHEYSTTPIFSSHLITYSGHAVVSGGTATGFLKSLTPSRLNSFGSDTGTGLIFHGTGDQDQRLQLAMDQSIRIPDGLYLEFRAFFVTGLIDYTATLHELRTRLDSSLATLGLQLKTNA